MMRRIAGIGLAVAAAAVVLEPVALAAPATPMEVRGWILADPDAGYCARAIRLAPKYGINQVQISHGIAHYADDVIAEPKKAQLVRDLCKLAHINGLEALLWTHELQRVPDTLKSGGLVRYDDEALWRWLSEKYTRFFEACPEADGIVLSLHETSDPVYDNTKIDSASPRAERVRKLVDEMQKICERDGKTLYVRTFAYQPKELAWLVEGLRDADKRVRVMSKCVPHDWQPAYPHNPAIGAFHDRVHIVEFDLGQEYYGSNLLPFDESGYMQMRLRYAASRGCKGAAARIDRGDRNCLGTVNEFNMAAFSELVKNPDADLGAFWERYAAETYGAEAGPHVTRALRRTFDIVTGMYLCFGYSFLSDHTQLPDHGYSQWILHFHSNAKWDAKAAVDHIRLLAPDGVIIAQAMAEKEEAAALLALSMADLERARPHLSEKNAEVLFESFERLERCLSIWTATLDCYLWQKVFAGYPTENHRGIVQEKVEALRAVADEVEAAIGADSYPDSAKRAREFAGQVETSANELLPFVQPIETPEETPEEVPVEVTD